MDHKAVDEACEAVDKDCDGDIVFVGTQILVVGRKAVSGGNVLSDSHVIIMGHEAIGGKVFAGSEAVDEGHNTVAEGCDTIEGCNTVDNGCNTLDKAHDALNEGCKDIAESCEAVDEDGVLANECGDGIGCRGRVVGSWWLGVGLEMQGAINMDHSAVDKG